MKENLKAGMPNREAVSEALDYAIKEKLLDGYFESQKMEVMNMSLTEFNQEEYDRNRRREGMEEGEKLGFERGERSGITIGKQETARNLIAMGILSHEQIAQATDLSLEELKAL